MVKFKTIILCLISLSLVLLKPAIGKQDETKLQPESKIQPVKNINELNQRKKIFNLPLDFVLSKKTKEKRAMTDEKGRQGSVIDERLDSDSVRGKIIFPSKAILGKNVSNETQDVKKDLEEGVRYFKEKNYIEALKCFDSLKKQSLVNRNLSLPYFLAADSIFEIIRGSSSRNFVPAINAYVEAFSLFPDDGNSPRALYMVINCYLKMKFFYEADSYYNLLIEKYHNSKFLPKGLLGLAYTYYDYGMYKEALERYQTILEKFKDSNEYKEANFGMANTYFKLNNYKISKELFDRANNLWPDFLIYNPKIWLNFIEVSYKTGNREKAKENFKKIINVFPQLESIESAFFHLGKIYREDGKEKDAKILFTESISRNSASKAALQSYLELMDKGYEDLKVSKGFFDLSGSKKYILPPDRNIFQKYPGEYFSSDVLFRLTEIFLKYKKYQEAILALKINKQKMKYQVFQLPNDLALRLSEAAAERMNQAISKDDYAGLIQIYEELEEIGAENILPAGMLIEAGEWYRKIGLFKKALVVYEKTLRREKSVHLQDRIYYLEGMIYKSLNDNKGAQEILQRLISQFPRSQYLADSQNLLGDIYFEEGDFKKSLELYIRSRERYKMDPRCLDIDFKVAGSYEKIGNHVKSAEIYRDIISRAENSKSKEADSLITEAWINLGDALANAGNHGEAVKAYEKGIGSNNFPEKTSLALYRLSFCYRKMSRYEDSLKSLDILVSEKAGGEFWRKIGNAFKEDLRWAKENRDLLTSLGNGSNQSREEVKNEGKK